MDKNILSKIFMQVYDELTQDLIDRKYLEELPVKKNKLEEMLNQTEIDEEEREKELKKALDNIEIKKIERKVDFDEDELEEALEEFLISIFGKEITLEYEDRYAEIKMCFESILKSGMYNRCLSFADNVKNYTSYYQSYLYGFYYVPLLIEAINHIYSNDYNGEVDYLSEKIPWRDVYTNPETKSIQIGRSTRKNTEGLPYIIIGNINRCEKVLKDFVAAVKESDSYYNIFSMDFFKDISESIKIRALFESVLVNATNSDLNYIENFFEDQTAFVRNEKLRPLQTLGFVGEAFDDELYVMLKRAELEYETPYCITFMLKNKVVELPNLRLGVDNDNVAHILAVQSSQSSRIDRENTKALQDYVKKIIPKSSSFRFYNPLHLVSLFMGMGLLKGLGITKIEVADYLPLRFLKTSLNKHMNEEEREIYQRRLTDKNLFTYMRLARVVDGIDVIHYAGNGESLILDISGNLSCENETLQQIYEMCLNYAKGLNDDIER